MICILDPLTCGFTKVLVYQLFTSNFEVKQKGDKKVWQGNMTKNDLKNSKNVTLLIAKMIPVTKHLFKKSIKSLGEKRSSCQKIQNSPRLI